MEAGNQKMESSPPHGRRCSRCYLNSDEQRAYEIAASDEIIDNYFRDIQAMTVEGVRKNPDAAFAAKEYFQVLMYLERIGDYARNLCEWVVYLKSGKIIEL